MPIEVRIPSLLKPLVGGSRAVPASGNTVAQVLDDLEHRFPGIKSRLMQSNGHLHPFVNIFLNDEDIRFMRGLDTPVQEGDVVAILPAIAGGSSPKKSGDFLGSPGSAAHRGLHENAAHFRGDD